MWTLQKASLLGHLLCQVGSSLAMQGSMALAAESCMPADAVKCGGKAALS